MLHIGLTGGIGSGKSTVAAIFGELGAVLLDADLLVRDLLGPGQEASAAVGAAFGPAVQAADGSVNRKALAALAFSDEQARRALEAILHPRILARRRELLDEIRGRLGEETVVVTEAALIFEAGTRGEFDEVVLVTAPEGIRRQRLEAAGWDAEEVRRRMEAQWPDSRKLPLADHVVDNGGSPAATRAQAERLWRLFQEKLHAAR
ncbi:MAG: dephospho-CoA kinase [Acidobacteriota bacterium]